MQNVAGKWSINRKKKFVSQPQGSYSVWLSTSTRVYSVYGGEFLTDSTTLTITYMAVSMVINILTTLPSLAVSMDPLRFPGDPSYAAGKLEPPTGAHPGNQRRCLAR